ncbi:MAG TPA: lipid II flippase MurJ, partial [Bryobacteraceae bacterium]|nr:lipid II flippase MurJ [Bryobacteraceae bacterium]
ALVRGSLVVGAGILIGNVTGFFRVALAAYLLGTRAHADALAVSTGLADTVNNIVINTLLVSFVPMLMLRPAHERLAVFRRAGRLFAWILGSLSVLIAAFTPQLVALLGPGLAPAQKHEAIVLMEILAPSILLSGASGIYAALLYTERRFLAPATYQLCINGATVVFALLLWKAIGEYGFAVGYSVGAAVQLAVTWFASRDLRVERTESVALPSRGILSKPGLYLMYAALMSANIVLARAFATHAGAGVAAALDYSMRCVNVVIAYLVYPVANSLMPEIARLQAANETPHAYRLMRKSVGLMAIASVISCAAGLLLRTPIIALLFQRGSFTAESTTLVSNVFIGLAPSLIGWTLMDLISRCSFALDRPRLPLIAAFVPVSVNAVFLEILHLRGALADPVLLGLGASTGLIAGFLVLFLLTRSLGSSPAALSES